MDFIKRNMFFIVCAGAAIAGVALGVTGLQAMPKVVTEMKSAESIHTNLEGIKPVNEKVLDAEEERIDAVNADRAKVLEKAEELYPGYFKECTGSGQDRKCKLDTLVDGIFPDAPSQRRVEFRAAYRGAMDELLSRLNGGTPSSPSEQNLMSRKIEDEKLESRLGPSANDPKLAEDFTGPTRDEAGMLTRAGLRQDPRARADVQAAQRIFCYLTPFIASRDRKPDSQPTLQYEDAFEDTSLAEPPYEEEIWRAQVGYWIQRDIIDAIVDVNNDAAEELQSAGQHRWVATMPVKDVISIRLGPDFYVPKQGALYPLPEPGGYSAAVPPGTAETVFTHTASGPYFEVVQVSVKLVMDQRDILKLVERISNNSFYTLVRAAYQEVPANLSLTGKIYGWEPAVNVVLDFEFVMLGELFRPWMPQAVCEQYAIECPERDEAEKED